MVVVKADRLKIALAEAQWGPVNLLRQTHFYSGDCGNALFMINKDGFGECDFILSFNNKITEEIQRFPIHKRIYLCMENPSVWHPSSEFLNQFGLIFTPFSDIYKQLVLSSKVITSFPCVPWFYDISFSTRSGLEHVPLKCNSELFSLETGKAPIKKKLVSIILSSKSTSKGYQWRNKIASCLQEKLGDMIDIFGFGHQPLENKKNGIDPYLVTIVFENESHPYYITEKIVDAFIGWSTPIYCGSETITDILPDYRWTIPFGCDIHQARDLIISYINEISINPPALHLARKKVMKRLNLFAEIPSMLERV